jgi:hypothetical protein
MHSFSLVYCRFVPEAFVVTTDVFLHVIYVLFTRFNFKILH